MTRHRVWLKSLGWLAGILAVVALTGASPAEPALELVQTIVLKGKAGKLDHATLDAKRNRLLVANKVNNTLDIVDLEAGKLLKQVPNQQGIQGIAYAADLDRVFVGLGQGGFCNVFDGENYKLQKTIKFADDADNVRYDARTHLAYVAHAENALGVIDARTLEKKTDIKLPGGAEAFQLDPEKPRLLMNVPEPSQVIVIDADKNEIVANYPLKLAQGNNALAFDAANHRLFLGCGKAPSVVLMDSESGKEISSVAIPKGIDDLFYDAKRKRLYASCSEGFIAVLKQVDADHYEVEEKIATAEGAKTAYFDAATGRYFLIVPRQSGKPGPEVRVYQAKP